MFEEEAYGPDSSSQSISVGEKEREMVGMYGSSRVRRRPSADEHLHARWLGSKLPLFAKAPLSGNTLNGPPGTPPN